MALLISPPFILTGSPCFLRHKPFTPSTIVSAAAKGLAEESMADQVNCVRLTRAAAKKRAAESAALTEEKGVTKKRVVLGELSNLSNIVVSGNKAQVKENPEKQKPKTKTRVVKPASKDVKLKMINRQQKRYLSLNALNRQRLQLLGVSSMLIASKYEEIYPPNVEEFCYITENTYKKEEVVEMEADILKAFKFELGNPTVQTFLRRFTKVAQEDYQASRLQLEFLGCYLAELSLLDYGCVKFLPSRIAASVMFLASFIIQPKKHPWSPAMQQYTGYKASDLKECVLIIHDLYMSRRGGALQTVREKYKQQTFECVATMSASPEIPDSYF
ncbi:hypothetical protein GQ457_01G033480 [Hibiscus cannabinus]